MSTQIEWADEVWNPVTGCTKVSPGCAYCFAERVSKRFGRSDFARVTLHPDRLGQPLRWRKPRRVFVDSMGDLFHEDVSIEFIDRVFATMVLTPQHTYQVLTKRPERMREYLRGGPHQVGMPDSIALIAGTADFALPFANVQLGVSAENQRMADLRVPVLLETPAAVRFVSLEPLLGDIMLGGAGPTWLHGDRGLFWVIAGGESAGPANRRLVERCDHPRAERLGALLVSCPDCRSENEPAYTGWRPKPEALEWVRAIRDQCQAPRTPFFWKQWGGPTPKSGGALLDGREWRETP